MGDRCPSGVVPSATVVCRAPLRPVQLFERMPPHSPFIVTNGVNNQTIRKLRFGQRQNLPAIRIYGIILSRYRRSYTKVGPHRVQRTPRWSNQAGRVPRMIRRRLREIRRPPIRIRQLRMRIRRPPMAISWPPMRIRSPVIWNWRQELAGRCVARSARDETMRLRSALSFRALVWTRRLHGMSRLSSGRGWLRRVIGQLTGGTGLPSLGMARLLRLEL